MNFDFWFLLTNNILFWKREVGIIQWPDLGSGKTFKLRFSASLKVRFWSDPIFNAFRSAPIAQSWQDSDVANFYLNCENFLQGFCSPLEAPSGPLLRVGFWIPSAQLSPPWWQDICIYLSPSPRFPNTWQSLAAPWSLYPLLPPGVQARPCSSSPREVSWRDRKHLFNVMVQFSLLSG